MATSECTTDPLEEFHLFVRCTICLDTLTDPRTLPCLHTFCTSCLDQHVRLTMAVSVTGRMSFNCPACREETFLPLGGVKSFRRDFRMEQVRELIKSREKRRDLGEVTSRGTRCGICSESTEDGSVYQCEDCRKHFCELCSQIHGQIPVFSGHTVIDCNSSRRDTENDMKCSIHRDDILAYICQDCIKPVCATCVMKFHGDHVVVSKNVGIKDIVDELSFQHKALLTRKSHLRDFLSHVKHSSRDIRDQRTKLIEKIKCQRQELIENVYKQEIVLLQEVQERYLEESTRLSHTREHLDRALAEMSESTDSTAELLKDSADINNLQRYVDLTSNFARLVENSLVFDFTPSFLKMNFTASMSKPKLGRLCISTRHAPASPVGPLDQLSDASDLDDSGISSPVNSPRQLNAVATCSEIRVIAPVVASLLARLGKLGADGGEFNLPREVCFVPGKSEFVVCDTNNERLQIFDTRGLLVKIIGQGEVRPWGVTCTSRDQYVITDNKDKCVKVYSSEGELVRQVASFLCPCGVAITSRGLVIVTDFFSTCAYIVSMAGEIVRQIKYRSGRDKHACGPSRVAVTTSDVIIISDVSNASIKAYSIDGRQLWCIVDQEYLLSPQGVCVTNTGVILVTDTVNHAVVQFTDKGEYLGPVQMQDVNLKEPTSVAVSNDGVCVIARSKSNEVRIYKLDDS